MNDPIKVIFRFKNNNRRIQHHLYIFVGKIPSNIMTILNKIQELDLYNSWIELNPKELKSITSFYGQHWYRYFFITHHITSTIQNIKISPSKKKELKTKFGNEWYEKHINMYKTTLEKVYYSYSNKIKDEYDRRIKRQREFIDEDIIINYKTHGPIFLETPATSSPIADKNKSPEGSISKKKDKIKKIIAAMKKDTYDLNNQYGGDEDPPLKDPDEDENLESDEIMQDEADDMQEIESIYKDLDVEKTVDPKTNTLIKQIIDRKTLKKKKNMVEFDTSKDDMTHNENVKNVFKKFYVTSQYIFKDDSIKTVKSRIGDAISNNAKFGKFIYIAPSRQYLWSEYSYQDRFEPIMIGHKWVHRSELLKIDVMPNPSMRIYEELRGNLKILRDNIRRYGSKIKKDDDDNNILYDYDGYFTNNEIYMMDVYNELGNGYSPDSTALKNIIDVYVRIYFPRIWIDDVQEIIEYLNEKSDTESIKMTSTYDKIHNNLLIENEIMETVESVRKTTKHHYIFKGNHVTQSVIHVRIRVKEGKMDLFRIFNEFKVNDQYPFIQYQTIDGRIIFKYNEKEINKFKKDKNKHSLLKKWFENAPYGISFKVKINENGTEKFIAITLTDNKRIEYKTVWKEEEKATVEDINKTYRYVKDLIKKLNGENNKLTIHHPKDEEFKYAFINSIQKFILPDKFIINHNNLSEFSRYFYPYVALVIDPRKRQAKIRKKIESSKYGTYLRYKRISKYDNKARMEQRILYFMRNYEYNNATLSLEISKQFNITEEKAASEIERVQLKYPNVKKSRKTLKKLVNIPKYKPPGIGIDIQGRDKDKYKIRISGARDQNQLDRIISFMNILIWLYIETYLYKKKDRQELKEKLKILTHIAHRRNKVDDIVIQEKSTKNVKEMTQLDKKRIGFKPGKDQNQWTRSCQNSGLDKRRRPQYATTETIRKLLRKGYKMNKKSGMYEKEITLKNKSGKKEKVTLRAAQLPILDDQGKPTDKYIYYTCSPEENGKHMHVGFLTRSSNPYGQCMPCCFINDPVLSDKKEKRDYFLRCIGKLKTPKEKQKSNVIGDRLYILQDTNKIQEGRLSFLPNYLDFFFNFVLGKIKTIKHHYLVLSKTGYFFKFGTPQFTYPFLNAVASLMDTNVNTIKAKIISRLEEDKNNKIFTSLNNGDIKTRFGTKEKYIDYIKTDTLLDFKYINNIISVPGILDEEGLNIIVFNQTKQVIKSVLEKDVHKEDFTILCQNTEEIFDLSDEEKTNIIIIKENKGYYPVVMVIKNNENTKNIEIIKRFKYMDDSLNIINNIFDFHRHNCKTNFLGNIGTKNKLKTSKETYYILNGLKDSKFHGKYQIADTRNKIIYIITKNSTFVPVRPSGSIYSLTIVKNVENQYIKLTDMIKQLQELYIASNKELPVKPIGVYYDSIDKKKNSINIIAVMTKSHDSVPVIPENVPINWVKKNKLNMKNQPLFDKIDKELEKGRDNYLVDERIKRVNEHQYFRESYELFRLEFSEFIDLPDNARIKAKLERIINNKKLTKGEKKYQLKKYIFGLIDKDLQQLFEKNFQTGGKINKLVHVIKTEPSLDNYFVKNMRDKCVSHKNKDECNSSHHCRWSHDNCFIALTKEMIVQFVDKATEELLAENNKTLELLKKDGYFVSDIVDYEKYTDRPGQKIVTSTNTSIKKVLQNLFGTEIIPQIGRRKKTQIKEADEDVLNVEHSMKDMQEFYSQKIINNNLSIFRAYANGFYWLRNYYYKPRSRNLGYYGDKQTDLANYFKSQIIDWLLNPHNIEHIDESIMKHIGSVRKFIIKITSSVVTTTGGLVELYILSKIYNLITIYVYDDDDILYIFEDGIAYNKQNDKQINKKYKEKAKKRVSIHIIFRFIGSQMIPDDIYVNYWNI